MLFIPSESAILLSAIEGGVPEEFEYYEFGGFKGKIKINSDGQFSLQVTHPSVSDALLGYLEEAYSFAKIRINSDSLRITCEYKSEIAKVRRNILSYPLLKAIEGQEMHRQSAITCTCMHKEKGELMWVEGFKDRVLTILSFHIADKAEQTLAHTFFKEMLDTRGLPAFQSAPSVAISTDPPPELSGHDHIPNATYVTLVLFPRNYEEAKRWKAIERVVFLREYMYGHLKAAKMYLHSRMRSKTSEMVLALAKARKDSKREKELKTMSGRTFVQQFAAAKITQQ